MKRMHLGSAIIAMFIFSGLVSIALADDAKPDVTGNWAWSFQRQNGDTVNTKLKLKQDGDKITGTITGFGGQEIEIKDAALKDGELTFKVTRKRNDMEITTVYTGKVAADEIKGKAETNRDGQIMSRDWDAKKSTDTTQPSTQPAT
jgi:hypothetical protein